MSCRKKFLFLFMVSLVVIFFVGCGNSEAKNKSTYDEAMALLNKGEYADGKELLETIPDYKDVSTVLEQIKWESKAYTCLNTIRMGLNKPESMYVKDIAFFSGDIKEGLDIDDLEMANKMSEIFCSRGEPVIVFFISGENNFGGSDSCYYAFMYGDNGYEYLGLCSSLDPNKCKESEKTVSNIINDCGKYLTVVGEVDLDRIHTIVKNQ